MLPVAFPELYQNVCNLLHFLAGCKVKVFWVVKFIEWMCMRKSSSCWDCNFRLLAHRVYTHVHVQWHADRVPTAFAESKTFRERIKITKTAVTKKGMKWIKVKLNEREGIKKLDNVGKKWKKY